MCTGVERILVLSSGLCCDLQAIGPLLSGQSKLEGVIVGFVWMRNSFRASELARITTAWSAQLMMPPTTQKYDYVYGVTQPTRILAEGWNFAITGSLKALTREDVQAKCMATCKPWCT